MRLLSDSIRRLVSFARLHPALVALLLCLLSGLWVFAHGLPTLQNDDIQIQFLLLDGGGETTSHSLFTHPWLETLLRLPIRAFPSLSWYLIFQIALFFLAAFYAALFLSRHLLEARGQGPVSRTITLAILALALFWLTHLLASLQYTQVAIFASCCAWLALLFLAHDPRPVHGVSALILFWGGLSLRFAAIVPGTAMGLGLAALACMAGSDKNGNRRWVRYAAGAGVFALMAVLLAAANRSTYERQPEWADAASYMSTRAALTDYPDTSGLDKTEDYRSLGLSTNDVLFFKGFWFHPAWDTLPLARQALSIHRRDCPGLFGSQAAAERGVTSFDWSKFALFAENLPQATPWVPLAYILLVPLLFLGRLPTRKQACILIPFVCVLFAFVASGRPSCRIYEPVLGFVTLLAGALAPLGKEGARAWRGREILLAGCTVLCVLFVFRHYRHGSPPPPIDTPQAYCARHPDTLFFTASIQNTYALYPNSLRCSPAAAWSKANIVPIADGWFFHTPTYRHYLEKRGVADPYRSLLTDRARLLTYIPHEKPVFFQRLRTLYRERYGTDVDLRLETTVAPCHIWRILPRPGTP